MLKYSVYCRDSLMTNMAGKPKECIHDQGGQSFMRVRLRKESLSGVRGKAALMTEIGSNVGLSDAGPVGPQV